MNCDEARPLIDASVDRELSAADEWRVRAHLAGCAQCQRDAHTVQAMARATRSGGSLYHRAPQGLGERIVAALPSTGAHETALAPDPHAGTVRERPRRAGWKPWPRFGVSGSGGAAGWALGVGWLATAMLVLCALGLAATLSLRRPAAESGEFADELVSSHVRSLISGRNLDVISTDKHTVKPWFNGKIDYAPPVEDLAAAGYPLIGGRLDYVGHERVAVLVYTYGQHVVDLYVFPPGAVGPATTGRAPPPRTSDGYALARWHADGMTWWAVTDAEPAALAGLRAALDARLHGG